MELFRNILHHSRNYRDNVRFKAYLEFCKVSFTSKHTMIKYLDIY